VHPQGIPWPASLLYNRLAKSSVFQRHYELVAEDVLSRCPSGNILDVGTGPGWLLVRLCRSRPGLAIIGVDVSPAMVSKARENIERAGCSGSVRVQEASADRLPFAEGSFDAVISTGSLHHWRDPVAGLSEIHRVLKAGGRGLVYDLVAHVPDPVAREAARRFGRLRMALLWLHSFEEPFGDVEDLETLAASTPFGAGRTRFVGVLCCLELKKE